MNMRKAEVRFWVKMQLECRPELSEEELRTIVSRVVRSRLQVGGQDLNVNEAPEVSNVQLTLEPPPPKGWFEVFNTDLRDSLWGHISNAGEAAREAGYKYMAFNNRIYAIVITPDDVTNCCDMGLTIKDLA